MTDDIKPPTPADMPSRNEGGSSDPDQTWIAHVVNGEVKSRVKSEDWSAYAKKNGL